MRLLVYPGLLQPVVVDMMHAGPANVRDQESKKKTYKVKIKGGKNSKNERAEALTPTLPAALARKNVLGEKKRLRSRAHF